MSDFTHTTTRTFRLGLRHVIALATVSLVAAAAVFFIVWWDDEAVQSPAAAGSEAVVVPSAPGVRYDGGPEEGTRGIVTFGGPGIPSVRYDGGPEEGTRGIVPGR